MKEIDVDYRSITHDEDAFTEYEQKFVEKGQPIYRAVWTDNKS
jgi:tRNA (guanine-N7-)-methyltransferase